MNKLSSCQTRVTRRALASHLGRRHSSRCDPSPPRCPSRSRRQCPSRSPPQRQGHRHANPHKGRSSSPNAIRDPGATRRPCPYLRWEEIRVAAPDQGGHLSPARGVTYLPSPIRPPSAAIQECGAPREKGGVSWAPQSRVTSIQRRVAIHGDATRRVVRATVRRRRPAAGPCRRSTPAG